MSFVYPACPVEADLFNRVKCELVSYFIRVINLRSLYLCFWSL